MSGSKSTWKRGTQTIGILLILVVFPLLSWFFLQSGLNFTKDKFDQLDSLGTVEKFAFDPVLGPAWVDTFMKEQMVLVGQLEQMTEAQSDLIQGIYEQLDDRKDLYFIFHDGDGSFELQRKQYPADHFLMDSMQVKVVPQSEISKSNFESRLYLKPGLNAHQLALIDTKSTVRGIYDLRDEQQRDLLVSHIVLLLPKE
jgi:hypothetical protein